MKSFKPTKFGKDTIVEFTLDDDTKVTETIAGLPIQGTKEEFIAACEKYGKALENGLAKGIAASDDVKTTKDKEQLIVKIDVK